MAEPEVACGQLVTWGQPRPGGLHKYRDAYAGSHALFLSSRNLYYFGPDPKVIDVLKACVSGDDDVAWRVFETNSKILRRLIVLEKVTSVKVRPYFGDERELVISSSDSAKSARFVAPAQVISSIFSAFKRAWPKARITEVPDAASRIRGLTTGALSTTFLALFAFLVSTSSPEGLPRLWIFHLVRSIGPTPIVICWAVFMAMGGIFIRATIKNPPRALILTPVPRTQTF